MALSRDRTLDSPDGRTPSLFGMLLGASAVLGAIRLGLTIHQLRRDRREAPAPDPDDEERTFVLQPILGGDPTLEDNLRENLLNHPRARFHWLVDEDDVVGQAVARRVAAVLPESPFPDHPRVEIFPPPPAGSNPKVFKLARALERFEAHEAGLEDGVDEPALIAVLDDDTVLPPGTLAAAAARLRRADLVTGLPWYRGGDSIWSELVAAFVNASSLPTYLPILTFQDPVTINGMFSVTRRDTLERLGGFRAIETGLCDDVELAHLYLDAGLRIEQTTLGHPLRTTVPDLPTYMGLMRRWMVFARRLLLETPSVPILALVVVPSVLPPILLGAATLEATSSRSPRAVAKALGLLLLESMALATVRERWLGTKERPGTWLLEVVARLIQPLHVVAASIHPDRIRWRTRTISVVEGEIRHREA